MMISVAPSRIKAEWALVSPGGDIVPEERGEYSILEEMGRGGGRRQKEAA